MARDKELDLRELIHVPGEHRKDSWCGFFVSAFVNGVVGDEGLLQYIIPSSSQAKG